MAGARAAGKEMAGARAGRRGSAGLVVSQEMAPVWWGAPDVGVARTSLKPGIPAIAMTEDPAPNIQGETAQCMQGEPIGANLPSAWNYGAIERALRDSEGREHEFIFEPSVAKQFESATEAYEFYNMYSWEKGFGIRYGRSRQNAAGRRSMQDIVCVCQGKDGDENSRSVRCGCNAKIRLLRGEDDGWYVSSFVAEHNHALSISCGERRQWKSHNRIDDGTRNLVRQLRGNNVQISRVCSIIGWLVVKMQLDDEKRVKTLLWCHGKGRDSYKVFGDVITFDTTYRTNLYNLPFALFVGMNNHFQTTIFGGDMLTEENISSFRWVFASFVETMDGVAPVTILTDQCMSMKGAIEAELPNTKHRWCKWHVLRKAKESLGTIYTRVAGFKKALHELLDEIVSATEFEARWQEMLVEYNLQNNQFLSRAYDNREMWAKAYFRETFCAGMTSTQRSESANHMLKTYVPRSAPMHLFLSQYNRMIADRVAEEGREEHATKQVRPVMRVGVPLEKHASKFYTRAMFDRFSKELFRSGSFRCEKLEDDDAYSVVMLYATRSDGGFASFTVRCSPDRQDYLCECKCFEHSGMPCRHVLKVLVHEGACRMPDGLFVSRWGKAASVPLPNPDEGVADLVSREARLASLHSAVYASAMELVSMALKSRTGVEMCMGYFSKAKEAISCLAVPHGGGASSTMPKTAVDDVGKEQPEDPAVLAPPRVRSRGRPKEKRMKPFIELAFGSKRKAASSGRQCRTSHKKDDEQCGRCAGHTT
ncbi:hypothetical protein ACQ4PT_047399 [Festuca glaucescens]